MNDDPQPNSYDETPYIHLPFAPTTPGRLAAQAQLFGMTPPPVATCRVLELGCASGDNLIPMAVEMPGATFLGIDLSARQIEQGNAVIAQLGLANIELRHADIAAVDAGYGKFDYIVSHGIYSWVPDPIREKLFTICRDNLAANGVGYISYNTLPGWSTHSILRQAMIYQARSAPTTGEKVRQARTMLDFLSTNLRDDTAYAALLREAIDRVRGEPDGYVAHEYLEDVNEPVYFHQFMAGAQRHGLQYLAEAEFNAMAQVGLARGFAEDVRRIAPDLIAFEQMHDILANRSFRKTLLVHDDVRLDRQLVPAKLGGFAIASPVRSASRTPSLAPGAVESFRTPNGGEFSTGNPVTKGALLALMRAWPQAVPFDALLATVRARVSGPAGTVPSAGGAAVVDRDVLGAELLRCLAAGIVELRTWSPPLAVAPSERPVASPLARLQARLGDSVTNLLHQHVRLDRLTCAVLPLLDGTRDRDAVFAELSRLGAEGLLPATAAGAPLATQALAVLLRTGLDERLPLLVKAALLLT